MSAEKNVEIIDLRVGVNARKWFVAEFRMKKQMTIIMVQSAHFQIYFSLVTTETLKLIIGLFPLTNVYDIWEMLRERERPCINDSKSTNNKKSVN